MKRVLAVPLLVLLAGCVPGEVRYEPEGSSPIGPQVRLPVPVRLGVRLNRTDYAGFHELVLRELRAGGNFAHVRPIGHQREGRDLDFVAELDYVLETDAHWYNYFTMFPGFVAFAPHWARLRWDFDITTRVRLTRPSEGIEVGRFVRRDRHVMAYTSPGYAVAADVGFAGIIFLPALISPFAAGFPAAVLDSQAEDYRYRFYYSHAGRDWAQRIANLIASRIEASLGPPGAASYSTAGRRAAPTEPPVDAPKRGSSEEQPPVPRER